MATETEEIQPPDMTDDTRSRLLREWGVIGIVLVFFFVSGACGLLYQVVWTRKLVLLFGTTSFAVSTVLSIFFLGLGIGSLWGGRLADRTRRPLFLYGAMEIVIGAWTVAFILLIGPSEQYVVGLLRGVGDARILGIVLRGLLATAYLIVPVTLMGATLPLLARFVTMQRDISGLRVGALYTLNTAGAVAGCAFTGFVLLADYGYTGTTYLGAAANAGVGILAIGLTMIVREEGLHLKIPPMEVPEDQTISARHGRLIVVAFALSGFVSLALEVVWTRLLSLVFVGTTYAFTTMLTTVLCGIALGSAVASVLIDRVKNRSGFFGMTQIAIAASSLGVLALFPELPDRFDNFLFEGGYRWDRNVIGKFLVSFTALFLPTFFFGMSFPSAFRAFANSRPDLGSDLGRLYSANTFGGVIGSLAGGFLLLPLIGAHNTIILLSAIIGVAGFLLVWTSPRATVYWRLAATGIAVNMIFFSATRLPEDVSRPLSAWILPGNHEVIHFDEGVEGTVVVSAPEDEANGTGRVLWINAVQATASIEKGVKMNRFQGVLPLLFDRELDTALFMCFGSGITAGTLSLHDFERIDAVEISEDVLEAAHFFEADNFGIWKNPRGNVNFIIDDGRNFLLTTENTYDLITFEPMPLALAGVSTFYTRDYYELCRDRLAPGGLVSQWVPLHGLNEEIVRSLTRTFVDVFPESTAWFINADLFLIGSNEPLALDIAAAQERIFGNDTLRAALQETYLGDLEEIVAGFFMDKEGLAAYAETGKLMTDDLPWAEFEAPRLTYENFVEESLIAIEPYRNWAIPLIKEGTATEEWIESLKQREKAHGQDYIGLKKYYSRFPGSTLEDNFRFALEIDPDDHNARFYLSEILMARARGSLNYDEFDVARDYLLEARVYAPHRLDVLLGLGDAYAGLEDVDAAREAYADYAHRGGTAPRALALLPSESP